MSVAVVDAGGHLQCAARGDGGNLGGIDIAAGKARAAVSFRCSSRQIADALAGNPQATASVLSVLAARLVLLPGAVPLLSVEGEIIGAVGAAGASPDQDEEIVATAATIR